VDVILVLVKQDGRSQEFPIRRSPMVIGRKEGAGLHIPDAGVSREHCELAVGEDAVTVRDLDSSNGTFVNATRVKEAELAPGDLLSIGSCVFVVRIDGFPKMIDPASAYLEGTPAPEAPAPAAALGPRATAPAPLIPDDDDSDSSSVLDFDFLDEDDDDQPKL
jgi:predicted component of type VI protein secretion system